MKQTGWAARKWLEYEKPLVLLALALHTETFVFLQQHTQQRSNTPFEHRSHWQHRHLNQLWPTTVTVKRSLFNFQQINSVASCARLWHHFIYNTDFKGLWPPLWINTVIHSSRSDVLANRSSCYITDPFISEQQQIKTWYSKKNKMKIYCCIIYLWWH